MALLLTESTRRQLEITAATAMACEYVFKLAQSTTERDRMDAAQHFLFWWRIKQGISDYKLCFGSPSVTEVTYCFEDLQND